MKKIELKEDLKIIGYRTLPKGTVFKVEKFNSRYIYVNVNGCTLRLTYPQIKKVQ